MNFRIADFGELTLHYKNYQDGLAVIEKEKSNFLQEIEPIRKEMNQILNFAKNGLILDDKSIEEKNHRFQNLQQEIIAMDNDFRAKIKKIEEDLNQKCYSELSEMIKEWSISNNIDVVMGKMEVVFNREEFECTNDILDIIKERGLYV